MTQFTLPSISDRDRRTLITGACVAIALFLAFRGIPAWRRWIHTTRDTATRLSVQLATARNNAASVTGITHAADSLDNAYLSLAPALLQGDSPAQAAATLAAHVAEAADAAGVRLGSVQLTVDSAKAGVEIYHIHVHTDGTGDVRGLTAMLQSLESGGAPLLAVRALSISQADPAAPANRAELLRTPQH